MVIFKKTRIKRYKKKLNKAIKGLIETKVKMLFSVRDISDCENAIVMYTSLQEKRKMVVEKLKKEVVFLKAGAHSEGVSAKIKKIQQQINWYEDKISNEKKIEEYKSKLSFLRMSHFGLIMDGYLNGVAVFEQVGNIRIVDWQYDINEIKEDFNVEVIFENLVKRIYDERRVNMYNKNKNDEPQKQDIVEICGEDTEKSIEDLLDTIKQVYLPMMTEEFREYIDKLLNFTYTKFPYEEKELNDEEFGDFINGMYINID